MRAYEPVMRSGPVAMAIVLSLLFIIPVSPMVDGAYPKDTTIAVAQASFWGEGPGAYSGMSASIVGDVNGDGYDDIVIGEPMAVGAMATYSRVALVLGKAGVWTKDMKLSGIASATYISEGMGDAAGTVVAPAGDVNGDGFDDFLISAPLGDKGALNGGQVYLILGKAKGWALDVSLSNANASFVSTAADENVGSALASGDLNGDGFSDIIIGASANNQAGTKNGKVYVIFGKVSGWTMNTPLGTADASFLGEVINDQVGASISSGGDLNGDGYDDLIIGMQQTQGPPAGRAYIIFGKASGWQKDMSLKDADASFMGVNINDCTACAVAMAGDVNGDGFDDALIGAPAAPNSTQVFVGVTYLVLGKATGWGPSVSLSSANAKFVGEALDDYSGQRLAGAGDLNGDDLDDIVISAYQKSQPFSGQVGEVYIIKGKKTGWANMSLTSPTSSFWAEGATDFLGISISTGGDVDGDGHDDLLVGSSVNAEGGNNCGQTYLLFYDRATPPLTVQSVRTFTAADYSQETRFALPGDTVYVELRGSDQNLSRADLAVVRTSSDSSKTSIILELRETGLATGIYRGPLRIGNRTLDPRLGIHTIKASTGDAVDLVFTLDTTKNASLTMGRVTLLPLADETQAPEDGAYLAQYSAANVTASTWAFSSNATWLKWDPASGNLTGTPNNTAVGSYFVNITVKDQMGRTDLHNFTLLVPNTPATISTLPFTSAKQDVHYSVDYNSSDDGEGAITWHLDTNATWLSINSTTGVLNGTPGNSDVGKPYVNVSVDDGNGGTTNQYFILDVVNANDPPRISNIDVLTALEDQQYSVQYIATDPDVLDGHTWSVTTNAGWLSMNSSTGVLSGTPTNADVGTYDVNVTVRDDALAGASHRFNLTVLNVNDPPTWVDRPGNITIDRASTFVFEVNASDSDLGDSLAYSMTVTPSSSTARINITTGMINWTPDGSGNYTFDVYATDGNATIHFSFTITVRPPVIPNHPPVITAIVTQKVKPGKGFWYPVHATDEDIGDVLQYTLIGAPAGMTISPDGDINWTPTKAQAGNYNVTVSVYDGKDSANTTFMIEVEKAQTSGSDIDKVVLPGLAAGIGIAAVGGAAYAIKAKASSKAVKQDDLPNNQSDMDLDEVLLFYKDGRLIGNKVKDDKPGNDEVQHKVSTIIKKNFEEGKTLSSTVTSHGSSYVYIQKGESSFLVAIAPGAQGFDYLAVKTPLKMIKALDMFEKANKDALRDWDGGKGSLGKVEETLKNML